MESSYFNPDILRFLLFQVHDLSTLFKYDRFKDLDEDSIRILLDSIKSFADQELYPFLEKWMRSLLAMKMVNISPPADRKDYPDRCRVGNNQLGI